MENSAVESLPAPSWLIDLEGRLKANNQNRQLGHEVGAGSPCLKCGDTCPGLELHFWRKLCISCKCKKEDHDIPPDDSVLRFDILLTNSNSSFYKSFKGELDMHIRRSNLSKVGPKQGISSGKSSPVTENERSTPINDPSTFDRIVHDPSAPVMKVTFDWVPPDTSNELAAAYMSQLPINKLPIVGSEGAKYRQIQLNQQIPLYDISPEVRHKLTPAEQQGFQSYLQDVRNNVGMGKIQKICQKSNLEQSVPHHPFKAPNHASGLKKKNRGVSPIDQQVNSLAISDESNSTGNNNEKLKNIKNLNFKPYQPYKKTNPTLDEPTISNPPEISALKTPGAVLLPPSAFVPVFPKSKQFPRDLAHCKTESDIPVYKPVPMPKMESDSRYLNHLDPSSTVPLNSKGFHSTNPNLSSHIKNSELNSNLDEQNSACEPVKKNPMNQTNLGNEIGAKGSNVSSYLNQHPSIPKYWLNYQLGFDSHPKGYEAVGERNSPVSLEENMSGNEQQLDMDLRNANDVLTVERPLECNQCQRPLVFGSVAIVTDRAGSDKVWHPQCFVCVICQELLVDLVYFYDKGKVYCGRHYAENKNIMRCCSCDELIFVNEYTYTEGKTYHVDHFCCAECDMALADKKYIMYNDQPSCLTCFDVKHSQTCLQCALPIRAEQQGVKLDKLNWHASPTCFKCNSCNKSLLNCKFVLSNNKPYCSKHCVPN